MRRSSGQSPSRRKQLYVEMSQHTASSRLITDPSSQLLKLEGIMNDFTATFTVDQTPEEVFAAINNVRGWWSGEIEGSTDKLGHVWTYRYQDIHYSKQEITEFVPGQRIVWHVLDGYLNFTEDKTEWTGTDITFDISPKDNQTEVRFTHLGLVPEFECFDNCSNAWGFYIKSSLRDFITTGQGQPNEKESGEDETGHK
jgi:uncharacterized protein YndB with AHSA1/START domain